MGKRAADMGPEPPKRPQSGYGQFVNEKRAEITATLLKEGADKAKVMTLVAKRAGELWKVLGEAEKSCFNKKAETLMLAYTKDMEVFKEAHPDFKKVKKLKRGESEKPPSRPPGAYAQWIADNRPMLTEKVMKAHNVDKPKAFLMLYKESRSVYDALSAEEKKKCEEKAEAAKVQFQAQHKEWKLKNPKAKVKENEENGNGKKPKRPLGAYAQWIADNRPMLTEKVIKEHNVDKAKAFLMLYKESRSVYDALPAAEKKKCEEKAVAAKVQFQAEHKEWKLKNPKTKVKEVAEQEEDEEEDGEDEEEEEDATA